MAPAKRGLECRVAVTQVLTDVRPTVERPRQLRCRLPPTRTRIANCRDPGGDKFLEVALAGGADPVVTNVWDLFASDPWRGGRIEVRAALAELPEKG
jgi:predicted nucleic acid-binding protein